MIRSQTELDDSQIYSLRVSAREHAPDQVAEQFNISVADAVAIITGNLRADAPGFIPMPAHEGLFNSLRMRAMSAALVNRAFQILSRANFITFCERNGLRDTEIQAGKMSEFSAAQNARQTLRDEGLSWPPDVQVVPTLSIPATEEGLRYGGFICDTSPQRLLRLQFSKIYNFFNDQLCPEWGGDYGAYATTEEAFEAFSCAVRDNLPEGAVWVTRINAELAWKPSNIKVSLNPDPVLGYPYEPYLTCGGRVCSLQDASIALSITLEDLEALKAKYIDDLDIVDNCVQRLVLPRSVWPTVKRRVRAVIKKAPEELAELVNARVRVELLGGYRAWLKSPSSIREQLLVLSAVRDKLQQLTT